jgi:HlyD family secretion protein
VKKIWVMRSGVVVVLLVALTALYARGRAPAEEENGPEYQLVERRALEVTAEAAGLIEPIRLVEVKSKASGEILRLMVESGDAVRRGDLLGNIDPRDVRNALAQAEADLDVAQARLETAQSARRRSAELREANVITEQEYESAKLEEANGRAQYVKARTNLELAQERMGDVTIRAPIDGVIIRKDVESGQIIQSASQNISGGTTVFVMADLNEMQVRTLVSETDLGKIQPGMSARVSVEAFPGRTFQGTVTKIEPQAVVEQNVTMFPVLVHLSNQDGALKPGMNAEVIVEVARRENAITVPNAAVVGVRDAVAAGSLFGLSEEQVRTAMRGNRGDAPQGAPGQAADAGTAAAAPQVAMSGASPNGDAGPGAGQPAAVASDAAAPRAAQGGQGSQRGPEGAAPQAAAGGQAAPAGQAARGAAGQAGRGQAGGRANRGGVGNADVRPGVVFIQTETGVEARSVTLGVNDWDHTEVLRGIEPGERVVLISVARLQQQQQEMLDRMRQRNSGSPFGGGGPGAGAPAGRR